jgi:tetratricopeptide (TPR) repeat protein
MIVNTPKITIRITVLLSISILLFASCSKNSPDFFFKNGNAKYQLKDYRGAIKDLDKAIELKPDFKLAYHTRAICFGELQKYDKALKDFNKAIELDPNFENVYLNRAYYVKVNAGDFKGAIEDYDKFIQLNKEGNNAFALNNRGFAKFNLNDTIGGLNDIQSSISMDSTNSYAFRNRALINIAIGSIDLACKDLNKAIELGYTKTYGKEVEELLFKYCNKN